MDAIVLGQGTNVNEGSNKRVCKIWRVLRDTVSGSAVIMTGRKGGKDIRFGNQ